MLQVPCTCMYQPVMTDILNNYIAGELIVFWFTTEGYNTRDTWYNFYEIGTRVEHLLYTNAQYLAYEISKLQNIDWGEKWKKIKIKYVYSTEMLFPPFEPWKTTEAWAIRKKQKNGLY